MTPRPSAIIVPLSKQKIFLLTLAAGIFVAAGVWLYLSASSDVGWENPLFVQIVAVIGVLFFGLCTAYGLRKMFDTTPGMVIDDKGIVDNSSGVSAGFIPWSDVIGFKVTTMHNQRFLSIEVQNPEKYIEQASGLKRRVVAMNAKFFGGPIHISSNTLKIRFDDLVERVLEAHATYARIDLSHSSANRSSRPLCRLF
ncbi:STM3941 family protein [Thiosocius teredinicola]|uniref:STM3941 family protein n=1 Tax=Thiosocius teredinicola TaxID=1973002 RepID=UPI000990D01C